MEEQRGMLRAGQAYISTSTVFAMSFAETSEFNSKMHCAVLVVT